MKSPQQPNNGALTYGDHLPAMSRRAEHRLKQLLEDHRAAVDEYVDKARRIATERWLVPRGDGKWTPAQETRHVILTYEAFLRDLTGERRMGLRGTPWKRLLWRVIGLTHMLWRKKLPLGVRAPREARPEWETASSAELLPQLSQRVKQFDATFESVWRTQPRHRVLHPMLGNLSLDQAIRLLSVHTRHHAAFLPSAQSLTATETQ